MTFFDRCAIPGCSEARTRKNMICRVHWKRIPFDLKERLRDAVQEGDDLELHAALLACEEAVSEYDV